MGNARIASSRPVQPGNTRRVCDQQPAWSGHCKLPQYLCPVNGKSFKDFNYNCISMFWRARKEEKIKCWAWLQDQDCKHLASENLPGTLSHLCIFCAAVRLRSCTWSWWKPFYSKKLGGRHELEAVMLLPCSCPVCHKTKQKIQALQQSLCRFHRDILTEMCYNLRLKVTLVTHFKHQHCNQGYPMEKQISHGIKHWSTIGTLPLPLLPPISGNGTKH